jgi:hypothetical protein
MDRRFITLFVLTVTLGALAAATGQAATTGAGPLSAIATVALGLPALAGLVALARIVYVDGRDTAQRAGRGP